MSSSDVPLTVNTNENYYLSKRFSAVQPLGYGSSGLILSAYDKHKQRKVAVKRITILKGSTNKDALREIKFVCQLIHENLLPVYEVLSPTCDVLDFRTVDFNQLQFVYMVEEHLDTDLHHLIRGRHIDQNYAKWFLYQLLRGLNFIHSANILHRDLKPSNLFIDCHQLVLKISDFGLCRVLDPKYDHKGYLTENVGTCWYRSPEQILSPSDYNKAIDLWSVGCVFAEMLLGVPLFTGANELNQMLLILDTIHLDEDDWGKVLQVMPNKLLKNHPFRPRTPLGEKFTSIDPLALELLEWLLSFDPAKRCSAEEALCHPYLTQYSAGKLEAKSSTRFHIEHEVDGDIILPSSQTEVEADSTEQQQQEHTAAVEDSNGRGNGANSQSPPPISICASLTGADTLSPAIHINDTHTLDEILSLTEDHTAYTGSISMSRSHRSSGSNSVEDLNMRNLAQSQENLASTPSCQNILSLSDDQYHHRNDSTNYSNSHHSPDDENNLHKALPEITSNITEMDQVFSSKKSEEAKCNPSKSFCKDEDEKDVAEISVEKMKEDEELESSENVDDAHETETGSDITDKSCVYYDELRVNIKDTENYKEYSQTGNKHHAANQSAKPKKRQSNNLSNKYSTNSAMLTEESVKERKLLEFYRSKKLSKFEAEKRENEKSSSNVEYDEMYRLPTEHLCVDRDYSNQRIKQKQIATIQRHQRQCLARYRDEINELNERLREASLDGAVGGVDISEESSHYSDPNTIYISESVYEHPASTVLSVDNVNQQRLAGDDGFSSPEELPSSPRASFSTTAGARPKKSPRKQKAL